MSEKCENLMVFSLGLDLGSSASSRAICFGILRK
jgi:hypothetical protein